MIDPKDNLSHYPNLANSFNKLDLFIKRALTFDMLEKQLAWAFNDYEQKRAIHRLYCVISSLLSGDNPYFQKLLAQEKQALIVLTLLDGCKNSQESIAAL